MLESQALVADLRVECRARQELVTGGGDRTQETKVA